MGDIRLSGCANCGQPYGDTDPYRRIERDHIVAWANGGTDDPSNLMPLCGTCNRFKNKWTLEQLQDPASIPWPLDFDWDTGEWIDWRLPQAEGRRRYEHIRDGGSWGDFEHVDIPKVRERSPAQWVHGELFDFPVRSHVAQELRVPLHPAPRAKIYGERKS